MKQGEDYIGVTIVFLCHDGQGNIVLAKRGQNCRDEQGTWDPGGGALEFGESVEYRLKKEIKEEYCTDVLEYEFLDYLDVHRENNGKKTHWIALIFKVLVDKEKVKNGEPHKLDEVAWFSKNNLPQPLHSKFLVWFEKCKDKI